MKPLLKGEDNAEAFAFANLLGCIRSGSIERQVLLTHWCASSSHDTIDMMRLSHFDSPLSKIMPMKQPSSFYYTYHPNDMYGYL
ncbi:hypothetical protein SCLCIDRAFT_1217284 [Scleroderma citrinum Foug A]|uniref:Uncharacterized protein n=1 Tax=Scleroderma citrinum Foug A TaxID=1036808 RepID=A0A0C3DVP8_9AGAM|nr:hypothetical protein SCLCIDRAFT_1217284 [Scleroderma citrinum Foug A]